MKFFNIIGRRTTLKDSFAPIVILPIFVFFSEKEDKASDENFIIFSA
ncbi:hypothetical protein DHBDCA_p1170 [Dehalobacter sp. DCA]|nr:hypothetical protein DHBDCA_p1170 [Dehalobacter sp. DCA]AFV05244.1 hypothetical protein DCF50_p1238 [Dehalobacter sp. CF]